MQGAVIFKTASQVALKVGFDAKTGLHLSCNSDPATNQPGPSTDESPIFKEKLQTSRGQFKWYSIWKTQNYH